MQARGIAVLAMASLALPGVAMGSVRHQVWSYGVDVGEEGESGTEIWLTASTPNLTDPTHAGDNWNTWLGLTTTLTDRIELAFFALAGEASAADPLRLTSAHGQLRLKLLDYLGVEGEGFAHYFPLHSTYTAYVGPGLEVDKGRFWGILNVAIGSSGLGYGATCSRLIMGLTL